MNIKQRSTYICLVSERLFIDDSADIDAFEYIMCTYEVLDGPWVREIVGDVQFQ